MKKYYENTYLISMIGLNIITLIKYMYIVSTGSKIGSTDGFYFWLTLLFDVFFIGDFLMRIRKAKKGEEILLKGFSSKKPGIKFTVFVTIFGVVFVGASMSLFLKNGFESFLASERWWVLIPLWVCSCMVADMWLKRKAINTDIA